MGNFSRKIQMDDSSYAIGGIYFCCNTLGPFVPFERSVTPNQYKVLSTYHFHPTMKLFCPRCLRPHPAGAGGLTAWFSDMFCLFRVSRTRPS